MMFLPCIRTPPSPCSEASQKTLKACDSFGGVRIGAECKARYAVLFQIRTFPPEPEDEAHIGPTATYDEVIYPGFQHDITALQIQGYTSHTIGIQVPEYITIAEDRSEYRLQASA